MSARRPAPLSSRPSAQVETCHEKIISLELLHHDTAGDALTSDADDTADDADIGDDDDGHTSTGSSAPASFVTVLRQQQPNERQLGPHQRTNSGGSGSSSSYSSSSTSHTTTSSASTTILQTIVEVVNPVMHDSVTDGRARSLAVGDGAAGAAAYPSFGMSLSEQDAQSMEYHGNAEDDDYEDVVDEAIATVATYDAYGDDDSYEPSLNDKMRNVLQELLTNERVQLNWSRSLIEVDEEDEDELDAADEFEQFGDDSETNGNVITGNGCAPDAVPPNKRQADGVDNDDDDDVDSNKNFELLERECANAADTDADADDAANCRVYRNPNADVNFANDDPITVAKATTTTTAGTVTPSTSDELLKHRLLAQLEVLHEGDGDGDDYVRGSPAVVSTTDADATADSQPLARGSATSGSKRKKRNKANKSNKKK